MIHNLHVKFESDGTKTSDISEIYFYSIIIIGQPSYPGFQLFI